MANGSFLQWPGSRLQSKARPGLEGATDQINAIKVKVERSQNHC